MKSPNNETPVTLAVRRDTIERLTWISWFNALAYAQLSFSSLHYLQASDPTITLLDNLIPRILFGTIPWILLGFWVKRSTWKFHAILFMWCTIQGLLFDVAASTHVWPLAFEGKTEPLAMVLSQNGAYFFGIWVVLALPVKLAIPAFIINAAVVWTPLFYVAMNINSPVLTHTILMDTSSVTLVALTCGAGIYRLHERIATLTIEREQTAKQFLGKTVSDAIFEGKLEQLKEETRMGYVVSIDIRDSSKLARSLGAKWQNFIDRWFDEATRITNHYGGAVVKTGGDSILITFGVFDNNPSLAEIPGLESQLENAEQRRWKSITTDMVTCTLKLFEKFHEMGNESIPGHELRIGGGIDRGPIGRGVRGNELRKELDIWGDRVNCASRLQEYSKIISASTSVDGSILVISPFAADYLDSFEGYKKFSTVNTPIKDFEKISWVLFKAIKANKAEYRIA